MSTENMKKNISLTIALSMLVQGGHIPAEIKFPVFSLSFPCVFFHKINRWFWVLKDFPGL